MTKYKCSHECDTIIMNNDIIGLSIYMDWKDTKGFDGDKSECFDCYCKSVNYPPINGVGLSVTTDSARVRLQKS